MALYPDVPGHDGKVMKIPPGAGMRGVVRYTNRAGRHVPADGTEIEVIGPDDDLLYFRVATLGGAEEEHRLAQADIDVGHLMFLAGEWRRYDDPLVVEWFAERQRNRPR